MERGLKMRLKIKNFAKVSDAEIKIDGITVIAGENNTGKSTIGKIIYSIFTIFHNFDDKLRRERIKGISKNLFNLYLKNFSFNDLEGLFDLSNRIVDLKHYDIGEIKAILKAGGIDDIDDIDENTLLQIKNQLEFANDELEHLIVDNIFHKEFNDQISPIFNDGLISEVHACIQKDTIKLKFENDKATLIKKMELLNDGIYIDNPFIIDDIDKLGAEANDSSINIFDSIYGRDDIYTHERVLRRKLGKSLRNKELLIDEALYKKRIENILDTIKDTVSGDFVEREDRFTFSERKHNIELELANLSTGIKSFAILLKLLENKDIKDNSLVVLDEPEVHLHPKWQLIYAKLLVLLQKEFDLNIVLTTHSPYFVTALDVYSKKYEIKNKCNYYLAELTNGKAFFNDVTNEVELIYKKLAEPFEILSREEDEMNEIELSRL